MGLMYWNCRLNLSCSPLRFAEQGDSTELSQAIDSPQEIKNEVINVSLNLGQLKPFLDIAVPFFKEDDTARNNLIGVGALTLLNSISVAFSYISRDFYNALNMRDENLFYEKIELFSGRY